MNKERVKSFGISFLGGHSGFEGNYELDIDSVRAVNEENADILGEPKSLVESSHRVLTNPTI